MPARQRVSSGSPYEGAIGFCRAVRVGDRVLVSGTAPIWPDGSCDPDPGAQARRCLAIIAAALADLGATVDEVVRTRMYLTRAEDADAVGAAHAEVFGAAPPASTVVVVAALLDPRWWVEMEAEAVVGGDDPGSAARSSGVGDHVRQRSGVHEGQPAGGAGKGHVQGP